MKLSGSKLDAEEAGYYDHFDRLLTRCSAITYQLYRSQKDAEKYDTLAKANSAKTALEKARKKLTELQDLANAGVPELSRTLPPATMRHLQEKLYHVLSNAKQAQEPAEIADECASFYVSLKEFRDKVERRSPQQYPDGTINIVYRPIGSPIGVGIGSDRTFKVEFSLPTPIGDFNLSHSSSQGVKTLIIRSAGQDRYFSLDRPFKLYVPADCGVDVSSEEAKTLLIEVKNCS